MAELKTKRNEASVTAFLSTIENEQKRTDAFALMEMMQAITGEEPKMWGTAIVGFGSYHYKYASGREGDWMVAAFAPRKNDFTLYLPGSLDSYAELLAKLGKHSRGKGCLYIKKLTDVDLAVLRELIETSVEHHRKSGD